MYKMAFTNNKDLLKEKHIMMRLLHDILIRSKHRYVCTYVYMYICIYVRMIIRLNKRFSISNEKSIDTDTF